jgi:hypothetical protein
MRLRMALDYALSSTSAEEEDLGKGRFFIRTDGMNEGGSLQTVVPDAATDLETIIAHIADISFLIVRTLPVDKNSDGLALTIKLNSDAGEAIVIDPVPGLREGFFMLSTTGLTKVYFTNASGGDIQVRLIVAGD